MTNLMDSVKELQSVKTDIEAVKTGCGQLDQNQSVIEVSFGPNQ